MDKAWYLIQAHLAEGIPVAELAAAHGVHRSWIYKLLARYRAEGEAGLKPRSRRPRSTPASIPSELEDEIVRLRKQLSEEGLDAGAATIGWHLARRHGNQTPSSSTIWRAREAGSTRWRARTPRYYSPTWWASPRCRKT